MLTVFKLHVVTLEQVVCLWGRMPLKLQIPNLEENVTPGLYIRSMHLHTEQLNENFRKT